MRTGMLALIAGLLSLRGLSELPPLGWLLPLLAVALMLLPYRLYWLGLFMLGFCWSVVLAHGVLADRLEPALDGRTLWLEGQVSGLPERREGLLSFQLENPTARRASLPARLRLSWRDAPDVRAGERWRLAVKLRRPVGMSNPQGFDYEAWLAAQSIGALGSVKAGQRLSAVPLAGWREELRQRLLSHAAMGREGAVAALVLGDDSGLSDADWQVLQATGTVHLLVISGQHVMLLAALVYALIAGLARLGWLPAGWPWLGPACLCAWLAAAGYGVLAGLEVPVQRALVMLALILLWRWRFRQLRVWDGWLLAMLLVLLWQPLASLQAGFWLSFGAVGLLIWGLAGRLGGYSFWQLLWRPQWLLTLGLLPVLLALGLPQSLSAPLANLLAVPWVSFVSVPLALLGTLCLPVPLLGEGLLWLAGASLHGLFWLLQVISGWVAPWYAPSVPGWAVFLALLGVVCLTLPAGVPVRVPGILLCLPLFWPPTALPPVGQAQVWLLDVGQGLAVLVRTREHALLYDAGPAVPGFDSGARIVLPSLRYLGVRQLDLLLLSHADRDHTGGAQALLDALPVKAVVSGEPGQLPASWAVQSCPVRQWHWNTVRFSQWQWAAGEGNSASCVLLIEAAGERLLLTGDMDSAAEQQWLKAHPGISVDWLLAPHHGSRTSSSPAFLAATRPPHVLLARGRYNPFGHPHAEVLARYREAGATVHDTALQGAIRIELGAQRPALHWRQQGGFWQEK